MNKKAEKDAVTLSPGELEILELLWNSGPLSISGVHQEFLARSRKIGYPTVQTRLNRLVEKGILAKNGQFPAIYEPVLGPPDVSGKYFDLLDTLCGGNVSSLMLHLVEKRGLKPAELRVLKEIIENCESPKAEKKK
ncbi:MAG: BlaI/MecI/CopY family transcriptional regulator [Thermoguttaceae bacterium]